MMHGLAHDASIAPRPRGSIVMSVDITPPTSRYVPVREVGNWWSDPLELGSEEMSEATLVRLREAELKHCRLAMLAAVAMPVQEICHPGLVNMLHGMNPTVRSVLVDGKSPSPFNGGLLQPEIMPALLLALVIGSVLEIKDLSARRAWGVDSVIDIMLGDEVQPRQPGKVLSFDPNGLFEKQSQEKKVALMESELLNGRLACVALAAYAAEEGIFQVPVVASIPVSFW